MYNHLYDLECCDKEQLNHLCLTFQLLKFDVYM